MEALFAPLQQAQTLPGLACQLPPTALSLFGWAGA